MKFCDEIDEKISLYIDGELDHNSIKEFEQHISLCNECRVKYEEIKITLELYRNITEEEPPVGLDTLIFDRINRDNNTLSKTKRMMKAQKYMKYISLAAAACLCIAVILTGIVIAPRQKNSESQISSMADTNVNKNSGAAYYDMEGKNENNESETRTYDTFIKEDVLSNSQFPLKSTESTRNKADINIAIFVSNFEEELDYVKSIISQDIEEPLFLGNTTADTDSIKNNGVSLNVEIPKSELETLINDLTDRYNKNLEITKNTENNTTTRLIVIINLKSK